MRVRTCVSAYLLADKELLILAVLRVPLDQEGPLQAPSVASVLFIVHIHIDVRDMLIL